MDNQYNYYNPQKGPDNVGNRDVWPEKQLRRVIIRRSLRVIMVAGLAILFGIVSSAVFLTSNIIGSRLLGLERTSDAQTIAGNEVNGNTILSRSSSVVTSDVSGVVEKVMPSIVSITSMSVEEVQSFFGGTYQKQSAGAEQVSSLGRMIQSC